MRAGDDFLALAQKQHERRESVRRAAEAVPIHRDWRNNHDCTPRASYINPQEEQHENFWRRDIASGADLDSRAWRNNQWSKAMVEPSRLQVSACRADAVCRSCAHGQASH